MGAGNRATVVEVLLLMHMVYNTSIVASGLLAAHKLVAHVGHAAVTEQMLANLIVACGKALGERPFCSLLQRP